GGSRRGDGGRGSGGGDDPEGGREDVLGRVRRILPGSRRARVGGSLESGVGVAAALHHGSQSFPPRRVTCGRRRYRRFPKCQGILPPSYRYCPKHRAVSATAVVF